MGRYTGKVALVTGSRRGVGKFVSEHFLAEGAIVIGMARGPATISHADYHHLQTDIGAPDAVQRAFVTLRQWTDRIDIVVNNAAVLTSQYAMIMPATAAAEMVRVNLLGAFMVAREAAKLMRRGKWGRIIGIGSMAASLEPAGDSVYAACKAALSTLNNVLAKELSSWNVTCNTVAVSAIESDMLAQLPRDKVDALIATLPVPRLATPDDILNVIDFLASERSSYITAQTIFLGGVN